MNLLTRQEKVCNLVSMADLHSELPRPGELPNEELQTQKQRELDKAQERMRELGLLNIAIDEGSKIDSSKHPRLEIFTPSPNKNGIGSTNHLTKIILRLSLEPERVAQEPNKPSESPPQGFKDKYAELVWERLSHEGMLGRPRDRVTVYSSAVGEGDDIVTTPNGERARVVIDIPDLNPRSLLHRNREDNMPKVRDAFQKAIEMSQTRYSGTEGTSINMLASKPSGKMYRVAGRIPLPGEPQPAQNTSTA